MASGACLERSRRVPPKSSIRFTPMRPHCTCGDGRPRPSQAEQSSAGFLRVWDSRPPAVQASKSSPRLEGRRPWLQEPALSEVKGYHQKSSIRCTPMRPLCTCDDQPRSGVRMQPTAQAVGKKVRRPLSPSGAKDQSRGQVAHLCVFRKGGDSCRGRPGFHSCRIPLN
jgi:hypothetical protein